MGRFNKMFEVKGEMRDGGEIKPDDAQKAWKPSPEYQAQIDAEANRVGFEDDETYIDPDIKKKMDIKQEFMNSNNKVEAELTQYYDDNITNDYLQVYLSEKLTEIYGEELERLEVATPSEMVESFLEYNDFEGVQSYRQLVQDIEDVIRIMRDNEEKAKARVTEKKVEFEPPTNEETQKMLSAYRNLSADGELAANSYIAIQAKKLGVDKEALRLYLRQQEKSHIHSSEKVLHYHRTSMESAKQILTSGYLLNRANIQLNGGDISRLNGSSSRNVQFSVDQYDEQGQLQVSGFDMESNLGAASTDIVFVMSPELIKEDTYDSFAKYPTVEKANIEQCCAAILAKNPEVLKQVQSILAETQMQIPTMLQEQFDRQNILEGLTADKGQETGFRLSSVNGKPINQLVTSYRKTGINESDLNSAYETISRTKEEIQQSHNIESR